MVFNKHKKISTLLFSLIFTASLIFGATAVVRPQTAHAAAAQCFETLFNAGANKPIDCSSAAQFDGVKGGGTFQANHCYVTESGSGSSIVWAPTDCSKPPFNLNIIIVTCNDNKQYTSPKTVNGKTVTDQDICAPHGGVLGSQQAIDCTAASLNKSNCGIINWLVIIINVLSGLVGLVLVFSLIAAGIQWTTAGDNPQQLAAAKTRIFNVIIAALAFIFMYAFLQFLIPGGIF